MDRRGTNAVIGAIALAIILAFGYALSLFLGGGFKSGFNVTATFSRAGQLLRDGSDVKLRGVLLGEVKKIDVAPDGTAHIEMRIFPKEEIPSNVGAAIRAKTLFGEKFIELELPKSFASDNLHTGSEIPESRTLGPFEVETILEKAVPLLEAVDPEEFGSALHALAEGLTGNERALRNANVQSEHLLTATERTLPNLERNLVHLEHFAAALNSTDTSLLQALNGLDQVGQAIRDHPEEFRQTLTSLTGLSKNLGDVFTARQADLGTLAGEGAPVLRSVSDRANKLPHIVDAVKGFLGVWVADLSDGPYWRIYVVDPTLVGGEPYAPGTEPKPRSNATSVLAGQRKGTKKSLVDVLLGAVPTDAIERAAGQLPKVVPR
ncbi:MAG: MCE family protein [Actinobacteria bacterium]|nr:MCE family protein [Actinomycetota bacterium]